MILDFILYQSHFTGRAKMVERKSALKRAPERPELDDLLEKAKSVTLTDDQLLEQQASFVYGNAPKGSKITKDSARKSAHCLRVTKITA